MVQETDGTILVGAVGQNWYKLTPDTTGSYINGTWMQLASEPVARLYFASQVLPDGKFFVAGAEYSGRPVMQQNWSNTGGIYDPISDTWSVITPYPAQPDCPFIGSVPGDRYHYGNRGGWAIKLDRAMERDWPSLCCQLCALKAHVTIAPTSQE